MRTLKFKSNINCTGCLSKVSPVLNEENGIKNWDVDLQHDDRVLTVQTDTLSPKEIEQAVSKAGFTLDEMNT
ncbi:MAG: heavy-metal-associated domain-containing protein [Cryomorphaceae bacterium]